MEVWKFVDYSSLSPLFALSITTERWGLEPFPGNLAAISGYWQDIKGSNNTSEPAWILPYSCQSGGSSSHEPFDWDDIGYWGHYDSVTNISASESICLEPQPCADSGCFILIEGIGKTTAGPANSNIIGLSHGLSYFLAISITIAIIMGCSGSSLSDPSPPPPPPRLARVQLAPANLRPYMNQPHRREQRYAEQAPTEANMAKEVARCSDLLRQMYALDILIWGMEENVLDEVPQREEMRRRANALFSEISRTIQSWRSRPGARWSAEERQHIEEICRFVDQHGARRYER